MRHGLMQSKSSGSRFKLDPRTKLLLMVVVNAAVFSASKTWIMVILGAIPISLLFAGGKPKAAILSALVYAASALTNAYLVPVTHGIVNTFVVMVSGMMYRLLPGLIMGYYLVSTTTVSEFIASMERMHVSQKIVIPLSVMFRFFPTVGEEARSIRDAMRMRGLRLGVGGFRKPLAMLEYRLVPLLMSSVKIGDELSAASLTRGLGSPVKRTNICRIGFGATDMVLSAVGLATFAGYLLT